MFELCADDYVSMVRRLTVPDGPDKWRWNDDGSITKPGVIVSLDCRMSHPVDVERRDSAALHFVLCGNSNTFACETELWSFPTDLKKFENISNHDSCWKYAVRDFINRIYFRMAERIDPDMAPIRLTSNAWSGMTEPRLVWVTYRKKPDAARGDIYELVTLSHRENQG